MKWPHIFLIGFFALTGCLSSRMDSWVGHNRDELVKTWGPPNQESALSDGGKSMVYIQYLANQYGGRTCRMVFNTDEKGVVKSWSYYGC